MHYLAHLAETGAEFIHPGGRRASEMIVAALDISDGMSVLDIGCGPAATLAMICSSYNVDAFGLDCLPEMLAAACLRLRARSGEVSPTLIMGRAEILPFRDGVFDRVYSESVIGVQSIADIRRVFSEVHRVLRPGGIFVVNDGVWKDRVPATTVQRINQECIEHFGLRQATDEPWASEDWTRELGAAGFLVESSQLLHTEMLERGSPLSRVRRAIGRLYSLGSPSQLVRYLNYRRRLRAIDGIRELLEGRLFVVRKAAETSV
jgi:SAM-dependent methyltransferase